MEPIDERPPPPPPPPGLPVHPPPPLPNQWPSLHPQVRPPMPGPTGFWHRKWLGMPLMLWPVVLFGLFAVVVSLVDGDTTAPTATTPDRTEILRRVWNSLSAAEQVAICREVAIYGADVVAYDIIEAAGELTMEAHDDTEWFLTELACD